MASEKKATKTNAKSGAGNSTAVAFKLPLIGKLPIAQQLKYLTSICRRCIGVDRNRRLHQQP